MRAATITAFAASVLLSQVIPSNASAQTTQSVHVPADQRAFSDLTSKYNKLYDEAPNSIQRDKLEKQYESEFCNHLPTGDVFGWVGSLTYEPRVVGSQNGIELNLWVHTEDMYSAVTGGNIVLTLDNYGAWKGLQPHTPTEIPAGSPLYDIATNLRDGDVIRFDATFVPYVSQQACIESRPAAMIGLVRFNSLKRLGWGVRLE
jgi:hypothetical protein